MPIKNKKTNKYLGPTYAINSNFEFFNELRDLTLKSSPAEKSEMIQKINRLGRVKLAVAAGIFMNYKNQPVSNMAETVEYKSLVGMDLLIIGDDINRKKLRNFLKSLEAEVGSEIKYAVMDKEEFQYRLAMFDRFVRVLLEGSHEKLINKLGI